MKCFVFFFDDHFWMWSSCFVRLPTHAFLSWIVSPLQYLKSTGSFRLYIWLPKTNWFLLSLFMAQVSLPLFITGPTPNNLCRWIGCPIQQVQGPLYMHQNALITTRLIIRACIIYTTLFYLQAYKLRAHAPIIYYSIIRIYSVTIYTIAKI